MMDRSLHVYFTRTLAPKIRLYTGNAAEIDAVNSVIGVRRTAFIKPSGAFQWQCQEEWDIRTLLRACTPHMVERKELAEALLEYLDASTTEELIQCLFEAEEVQRKLRARLATGL